MIENRFKKGLGRGLSSLLGDSSKTIETNKIISNIIDVNILLFNSLVILFSQNFFLFY